VNCIVLADSDFLGLRVHGPMENTRSSVNGFFTHMRYNRLHHYPARNEERNLGRLLDSLKSQTYRPKEITVVDDHSTDKTADVAISYGVQVMHSNPLPEGWLGKPWACWQGAGKASGDILVFLDADTFLEPHGLAKIIEGHAWAGGLISVQPYHRMKRAYEKLAAFFNIITMAGTGSFSLFKGKYAARGAFGPCLVCRREDYFLTGGHGRARRQVLESMGVAGAFREAHLPVSCYGGKGAVLFRMYPDGLRAMIDGFSKGFAEGANAIAFSMLLLLVAWVTGGVSVTRHLVQSAFGGGGMSVMLWACLYVGFSIQIYWMLRRIGNFGIFPCILFPVPLVFFVLVFVRSLLIKMGIGKVSWKGRRVEDTSKDSSAIGE
jgi:4,4'-diaponeurosporenoate glycosyltransferase